MRLNASSIRQRLSALEQYIAELEKHQRITLPTLRNDFTRRLAIERAFQAAIESCIDIAAHIVSVYQLGHPEESRDLFRFLSEVGYLDSNFAGAMMGMVAFRNRLVHPYWRIDVELLYQYFLQQDVSLLLGFREFTWQLLRAEEEPPAD